MWRREKRLTDWLAGWRPPDEPFFVGRLKEKLRLRFGLFPIFVKEESMPLDTRTLGGEEALAVDTHIQDGLASINAWTQRGSAGRSLDGSSDRAHSVELLAIAQVQDLKLPNKREARTQQTNLIIQAACRSVSIDIVLKCAINELGYFINALPKIIDRMQSLIGKVLVGGLLSHIEIFPYKRTSLKIDELSDSECKSFLCEAEAIKGVPVDRAELLAVFRHIPIEMISKMRYLAENKVILYTIYRGIRRTQTRVHDMAAVRDIVSQDVFLIPHRSRFRSVYLN
jgi:hypothetical protein